MASTKKKPAPAKKVKKASTLTKAQKEEVREELLAEMVTDKKLVRVSFARSLVKDSEKIAKKLNSRPKVIAVWDTEEGQSSGYLEEVKVNGAVARIPKGVPVLVPDTIAQMLKTSEKVEKTLGEDIPNQRTQETGEMGIRADRSEATKKALGIA